MRSTVRIGSVQPPVIPIIAELIRRNPGTISLGRGVVSYGPTAEALGAGAAYCRERVGELAGVRLLVLDALAAVADRCTVPDRRWR